MVQCKSVARSCTLQTLEKAKQLRDDDEKQDELEEGIFYSKPRPRVFSIPVNPADCQRVPRITKNCCRPGYLPVLPPDPRLEEAAAQRKPRNPRLPISQFGRKRPQPESQAATEEAASEDLSDPDEGDPDAPEPEQPSCSDKQLPQDIPAQSGQPEPEKKDVNVNVLKSQNDDSANATGETKQDTAEETKQDSAEETEQDSAEVTKQDTTEETKQDSAVMQHVDAEHVTVVEMPISEISPTKEASKIHSKKKQVAKARSHKSKAKEKSESGIRETNDCQGAEPTESKTDSKHCQISRSKSARLEDLAQADDQSPQNGSRKRTKERKKGKSRRSTPPEVTTEAGISEPKPEKPSTSHCRRKPRVAEAWMPEVSGGNSVSNSAPPQRSPRPQQEAVAGSSITSQETSVAKTRQPSGASGGFQDPKAAPSLPVDGSSVRNLPPPVRSPRKQQEDIPGVSSPSQETPSASCQPSGVTGVSSDPEPGPSSPANGISQSSLPPNQRSSRSQREAAAQPSQEASAAFRQGASGVSPDPEPGAASPAPGSSAPSAGPLSPPAEAEPLPTGLSSLFPGPRVAAGPAEQPPPPADGLPTEESLLRALSRVITDPRTMERLRNGTFFRR